MYCKIYSGAALGIEGILVSVEADVSLGLPGLSLVGYLSSSVKEASERVRAALRNMGYSLPSRRITVNLSPADIRKDGAGYDLAIAVSILMSLEIFSMSEKMNNELERTIFLGELGLDGSILPVNAVLPIVDYATGQGIRNVIVPSQNAVEAGLVKGINVFPVDKLSDVTQLLMQEELKCEYIPPAFSASINEKVTHDLKDIKGQTALKRGVIIAVAGFHNILMTGAAGSGKSMIAKCIPGIMPPLSYEESMELTKIYSVAGILNLEEGPMTRRPFRSPHQTITNTALLGGGVIPMPGEVSLASNGVLFLDEFPEFRKETIEALRQPLEDRKITVSRLKASLTFPARFMLVSARNNCPCGFFPDRKRCRCTMSDIYHYQNKISHPIMDRIDIRLEVSPVSYSELFLESDGMSSEEARAIILKARKLQEQRYKDEDFSFNADIPQGLIDKYIKLGDEENRFLMEIYERTKMSTRGYFRMLRLSRTIADVEGRTDVTRQDIEEAMYYRNEIQSGGYMT